MKKYKVLFCDLDGTLIETASGKTFPEGIWDMKFKFDVLDTIKKLAPEFVFIVSNQGGIEKGFVNERNFQFKSEYIRRSICEYLGIDIGHCDYQYCPVNNSSNIARKPNTRMLQKLSERYIQKGNPAPKIANKDCLMIGDASGLEGQWSDTDKKTAENFGIDYMDVNEFVEVYGKEDN